MNSRDGAKERPAKPPPPPPIRPDPDLNQEIVKGGEGIRQKLPDSVRRLIEKKEG